MKLKLMERTHSTTLRVRPEPVEGRSEHKFLAECDPALICPIEPDGKMSNDIKETPRFLGIETTGQISAGFNSHRNLRSLTLRKLRAH